MESSFSSQNSRSSRTFRWAGGLLGLIALAQGVAAAMAWKALPALAASRPESLQQVVPEPVAEAPALADPFAPGASALDDPHPEMAGPAGDEPPVPELGVSGLEPADVVVAAPLDVPITDEACLIHLDEGIYLRDRGDMLGAVRELRKALELLPDHPKLLYHLAQVLDALGQDQKAAVHWRQLRFLGQGAGNFYQLAVERLKEGGSLPTPGEGEEAPAVEEKERLFVISGVKVERKISGADGEVLRLEGTIERKQEEPADVGQLDFKVHFMDQINGRRLDRTTAQAEISWLDLPVDWADGTERFAWEYRQAPFTPDELVTLGHRKYYGYALELRYGDGKLQDIAAEPAFLADLARELPESTSPAPGEYPAFGDPVLFPGEPDAVLFPGDRLDR